MRTILLIGCLVLVTAVAVAEVSEKVQKKLDAAEAAYKVAVEKAGNARFFALQKATADRVKVLKQAMTEATKSGDLDGGLKLKELIATVELGIVKTRPKNLVKFDGHSYALMPDKATFHVAKRLCEEMGGHLVYIETSDEEQFVMKLCGTQTQTVWLGATDEEIEGQWHWLNGVPLTNEQVPRWNLTNEGGAEHHLVYWQRSLGDGGASTRNVFLCEWEN
ncbi:MAG: antigen-like isoform [Planctomycetaceae bacterium]|nr:antigen-like isoform [Planctomycetaceae bacterium]